MEKDALDSELNMGRMQVMSLVYLAIITISSALAFSPSFAFSVCAGGIISIVSFWVSQTNIIKLVHDLVATPDPEERSAKAKKGKGGYLYTFWIRLAIIGVVLFLLIRSDWINIFGLILGLSTVVFTITVTALTVAWHYFFSGRR